MTSTLLASSNYSINYLSVILAGAKDSSFSGERLLTSQFIESGHQQVCNAGLLQQSFASDTEQRQLCGPLGFMAMAIGLT